MPTPPQVWQVRSTQAYPKNVQLANVCPIFLHRIVSNLLHNITDTYTQDGLVLSIVLAVHMYACTYIRISHIHIFNVLPSSNVRRWEQYLLIRLAALLKQL